MLSGAEKEKYRFRLAWYLLLFFQARKRRRKGCIMSHLPWLFAVFSLGVVSIGASVVIFLWVKRQGPGTQKAREISGYIRRGASTYLRKLDASLTVAAAGAEVVLAGALGIDRPRLGSPQTIGGGRHRGESSQRYRRAFPKNPDHRDVFGVIALRSSHRGAARTASRTEQAIRRPPEEGLTWSKMHL
jgi:hypothetical protein